MKFIFRFFLLFSGVLISDINQIYLSNAAYAKESLQIQLDQELKEGNLLIGLKQYLGGEKDTFSKNKSIRFAVNNSFLNLKSFNGITHKSKEIIIKWKEVPLNTPYIVERYVSRPFASFESAKKEANLLEEQGFEANVVYPNDWEVWISSTDKFSQSKSNYKLSKKIYESQITPFLSYGDSLQRLEGPLYLSAKEEIQINDINYGKNLLLAKDSYGTWTLIKQIKFDDYLEGVLPYEIGPNSPLEALKAQAVIARTWAIYNSERFNMDKYHLCITTQCQVYKPTLKNYKKVKQAIKETSNLIITFKNKPINSFYHGSNGGISARASESWKIDDFPYLQTKIDMPKSFLKSFKVPFKNEIEFIKFLDFQEKFFYGHKHSLFRWNKTISNQKISNNLIKNKLLHNDTKVLDIKILERGLSGRITKLEILTNSDSKSIVLVRDDIRRILTFLPSNLFIINKLNDNLWFFRGGGFGHGVGLSQSGAIEMAEMGFTYAQILNHYYRGTKINEIGSISK